MWVCGLKPQRCRKDPERGGSHPMWVCGLKLNARLKDQEIKRSHPMWVCGLKPGQNSSPTCTKRSHPMWVCGLKHLARRAKDWSCIVTPHVGVWIETSVAVLSDAAALSHPMLECELKPFVSCRSNMRNLKNRSVLVHFLAVVTIILRQHYYAG